ncbi:MAG: LysM peptidoglycan-binding domain-containing protein [Ilumatobacteraceae bacterium]
MLKRAFTLVLLPMTLLTACGGGDDSSLDSLPMLGTQAPTTLGPDGVIATTTTVAMVEQTYTIQQGDTLSYIAGQFGVTVEAIVAANGLANPDAIQAGQKVIIPAGGVVTTTAAPTTTTAATTTAAP